MHQDSALITLRGIERSYYEGGRPRSVLNGLDLDVRHGEWIALVGRSGCGKSTLLNVISGIDLPDRGDVTINGQNITRMSERQRTMFRRRHVGFIFQFFNLIPILTVEENLLLPLELNQLDRERAGELLAAAISRDDDAWRLFEPFGLVSAQRPLGYLAAQARYAWRQHLDARKERRNA